MTTPSEHFVDAVVVGAGVVGLACARQLARSGLEVVVLEAQGTIGQGISSRNSEVIHAGIYYQHGSLKSRLCVKGRRDLYRYCRQRGISHRELGKWIVATRSEQAAELEALLRRADDNGVEGCYLIDANEAQRHEPELHCKAVLVSPSTGIVDSHALMVSLQGDIESLNGSIAFMSPVEKATSGKSGITLQVGGTDRTLLTARYVVNAAGLNAPLVAQSVDAMPAAAIPKRRFAKGSYMSLSGKSPFSRLVYPLPEPGGLGIHLTLDMQGQARFGPDVEWVESPEYSVSADKLERFCRSIRTYWPQCSVDRMSPAYAGVRPKIDWNNRQEQDFVIQGPDVHGVAGLINLFGIESPGLTSCLAIAEDVAEKLEVRNLFHR